MIRTEWFTFASASRSGCRWVQELLEELDIPYQGARWHFPGIVDGLPSITIRRCPADWLQSCFQNLRSVIGVPAVDRFLDLRVNNQTFVEFAELYLAQMPGAISEMFSTYQPSTYTLDLCNIRHDVVRMFSELSVPFDPVTVHCFPDKNVSKRYAHIPDELRARIVNSA